MERTKYREIRRNNVNVEKEAEFEKVITHEFYTLRDVVFKFLNYRFTEHIDGFREEFNCQSKHYIKFYLMISNEGKGIYFGRFLVSSLYIPNRTETEFYSMPSYDDRGNPTEEVNNILQNRIYDEVKVGASMEITFILSGSLDALTEYEAEQVEDLYDEGDDDEGYQDNQLTIPPTETPFILDNCSICLTAKPDILLIPCLHKSYCSQCEEAGKLTKCPTCREMIIKKVKI